MRNKLKSLNLSVLTLCIVCYSIACGKKGDSNGPVMPPPVDTTSVITGPPVDVWVTKADRSSLFKHQTTALNFSGSAAVSPVITVDTTRSFQSIDGFGYTLTGGSAWAINHMAAADKDALLGELFQTDGDHIGVSYLRISIGASDLSGSVWTYDDLASPSEPDITLTNFDMTAEKDGLAGLLRQILALNPSIKILATPWTAPMWMKDNNYSVGGSLRPEYYPVYAAYFVKFIQAIKAEGITIDAVTPQNEPENPNNNPSMTMTAAQEATFISDHLGPAFETAGLTTKIIVFDHNCDHPAYPLAIYGDANASKYADGAAFHLYAGDIGALGQVHDAYPAKNVYFTEQYVNSSGEFGGDLSWHIKNLIIGATRNWSRTVLEWNLATDPQFGPHTIGGCGNCMGALTIGTSVTRNVSYYIIAHAAKFVRPGSVRVDSNTFGDLPNVAFLTPDKKKVLIVLNANTSTRQFSIQFKGKTVVASLDGGAVGTYVW